MKLSNTQNTIYFYETTKLLYIVTQDVDFT